MRRKGYGDHADTGDGGTDTAASGAWVFPEPESVLTKALQALDELEAKQFQALPPTKIAPEEPIGVAEQSAQVAPLLQWLHETAGPRVGLNEVRRRLANLPGSMSDAIYEEREDRF